MSDHLVRWYVFERQGDTRIIYNIGLVLDTHERAALAQDQPAAWRRVLARSCDLIEAHRTEEIED